MFINILNINIDIFKKYINKLEKKKFCADQILRWIYKYNIRNFNEMTNISKKIKRKMNMLFYISIPNIINKKISNDGVIKWLMGFNNKNYFETVLIIKNYKATLCISSQIGCIIKCLFCYTGSLGFKKNLNISEIIGQLLQVKHELKYNNFFYFIKNINITNIVFMGMGEPLLNFKNVLATLKIITNINLFAISKKHIILSTSGIIPMIKKLSLECPVSLAISLHASNNKLRNKLVPINKKYSLKKLLKSCKNYIKYSPKKNITFEYCMLNKINDYKYHAYEILKLIYNKKKKKMLNCKFNLIPFNIFPKTNFKSSSENRIKKFANILIKAGIITTIRKTKGFSINASCGQLIGKL
ncbi:23S rRNA (adenine(2503)-C(2))-methyltransferase RlmN [Candidatus Zinderia endosymbiont of Aphrophora alni]|uniref:23S rRNA (adenine(2503)-C(2))-methyltransferase RlmN n=1 Tax=Candidatus Zinderia endosymbiont of Aphrophora alni TaxID=3077951 RepID=UPI0030D4FC01